MLGEAQSSPETTYDAFISYSHAADGRLAPAVQRGLHRFTKAWYARRALHTFRDEVSLAASPHLWGSIELALSRSRWFILLASPDAASSPWVDREVQWWLDHRPIERMLIVLTSGKLAWASEPGVGPNLHATNALPPTASQRLQTEPHWVDLTWARNAVSLTLSNAAFKDAIANLAAAISGRMKEELLGEDVEQQRRTRLTIQAVGIVLLMLTAFSVERCQEALRQQGFAEAQRAEAMRQQQNAEVQAREAKTQARNAQAQTLIAKAQTEIANEERLAADEQRSIAETKSREAQAQTALAERERRRAESELALSSQEQGRQLLLSGHPMRALPHLLMARRVLGDTPLLLTLFNWIGPVPSVSVAHVNSVRAVAFSPDGSRIVSASADESAVVWDAQTGVKMHVLNHGGPVSVACFSPDARYVLTGSNDSTARLWDATTGAPVTGPLRHADNEFITVGEFSPDGTRVVTGDTDGDVRVWNAQTGELVIAIDRSPLPITAAHFSPDGARILIATIDEVSTWSAPDGRQLTQPVKGDPPIQAAHFSLDGSLIVIADAKGALMLDAATGGEAKPSRIGDHAIVTSAKFSADGLRVITSAGNAARVWDARSGNAVTPPLLHEDLVQAVQISPDGSQIATAGRDNVARVWDATTGAPITPPLEHPGYVTSIAFSPDGARVVTGGYERGVRVWPIEHAPAIAIKHGARVRDAVFSADGQLVVTSGADNAARVWDARSGRARSEALQHEHALLSVQFGHGSQSVLTLAEDKIVRSWNYSTRVSTAWNLDGPVTSIAMTTDKKLVVTEDESVNARVRDALTGSPLSELIALSSFARNMHYGRDRTFIVNLLNDTARVRPAKAEDPPIPETRSTRSVDYAERSPDGSRLVTMDEDSNAAKLWDERSSRFLRQGAQHQERVSRAHFNPAGNQVITASEDHTARIWNAKGLAVGPPMTHADEVSDARFSSDGTRAITVSADGTARIWDARTSRPLSTPIPIGEGRNHPLRLSNDGTRALTIGGDAALVWTIEDTHPLSYWKARAKCAPFVLTNGSLVENPKSGSRCL